MAESITTPNHVVVLVLTRVEAKGLYALANEGAEGLLTDAAAAQTYIGDAMHQRAARAALDALGAASIHMANVSRKP